MMIHWGWALAAVWAGGCIGFVAGCWWAGACAMNALADKTIAEERVNAVAKEVVEKG